jgi:hypothetical protein
MLRPLTILCAALALAGCGSNGPVSGSSMAESSPPTTTAAAPAPVIDLGAGSYRGVSLGDSRKALFAALGPAPRLTEDEPWVPTGVVDADWEGPTSVVVNGYRRKPMRGFAYPKAFVMLVSGKVADMEIAETGAATTEGVAIGDELEKVEAAYPAFRCGTANEGTEYTTYPACSGTVGGVQVWIGGDPITTIALASGAVSMSHL